MTQDLPSYSPETEKTRPTRAQRRRAARRRKKVIPPSMEGRSKLLEELIERAYPSYEYFIDALLSGVIIALGFLLNAQAFLLFGILMAPLMSPLVGMMLATVSGSGRFFSRAFIAFLVGNIFIAAAGALAGFAARMWLPLTLTEAFLHSRLWGADLIALALGAILLAASFVRSEKKPFLPSVMVVYELFLPLSASAFALASGVADIFPQSIYVFAVHLAWAMLFGTLTLFFLGFRPQKIAGWLFSLFIMAVLLGTLAALLLPGMGTTPTTATQATPTLEAEMVVTGTDVPDTAPPPSRTPVLATASPKKTAAASVTPSPRATKTATAKPSLTPSITLTAEPTPLYALIAASSGGGAFMRSEPGGPVILTLENDELVEALSAPIKYEGVTWVQIRAIRGTEKFEGWIMQSVLKTATPAPGW